MDVLAILAGNEERRHGVHVRRKRHIRISPACEDVEARWFNLQALERACKRPARAASVARTGIRPRGLHWESWTRCPPEHALIERDPFRCGLLGRRVKDRWESRRRKGRVFPGATRAILLDSAPPVSTG